MKKLFCISVLICILLSAVSACSADEQPDKTAETTTEKVTETTAEPTQTTVNENAETHTIVFDDGKYQYTIEKTDFEKNYSEEELMAISRLVPMEYGYDDYYNWNGTPDEVINDALLCMQNSRNDWFFERYDSDSPQAKAALEELKKNPYRIADDWVITDINCINRYLSDRFGPQARQFKAEDFNTYNEIKTGDERITDGFGLRTYRYAYLPESGLVACFMSETTGFMSPAAYIYDIKSADGMYEVKALSASDNYPEGADTFEEIQSATVKMFNGYTDGVMVNYVMTIACDENGKLYMKSVDKSNILADNIEYNHKVSTDGAPVEVKYTEHFSKGMETVGTIPNGEKVYVADSYINEMVWVVTEEFSGVVEEKYLVPIE